MANPWDRQYARRQNESIETRKVLILCEDSKTSPNYFRKFPFDPKDVLIEVFGAGANTTSLVREAVRRKEEAERNGARYIEVWAVFDRDSFPPQHFNEALMLGKRKGVRCAYANQCFELWYWLHFDLQQTSVPRAEYGERLSQRLGRQYQKSDPKLYDELLSRQPDAIRNSKKLLSFYSPCNPEQDDPSTNIHVLVEYLNAFEK